MVGHTHALQHLIPFRSVIYWL